MKKLICFFVLFLVITSCSSDNDTAQIENLDIKKTVPSENLDLIGKWEWTSTSAGIAPQTPATTKKNYTLILNEDYSYSLLENQIKISNGKFSLKMEKSIYSNEKQRFITFQEPKFPMGNGGIINTYEEHTSMTISDNDFNGFASSYKKTQ